jgi:hypothetical protein
VTGLEAEMLWDEAADTRRNYLEPPLMNKNTRNGFVRNLRHTRIAIRSRRQLHRSGHKLGLTYAKLTSTAAGSGA